MVERSSPAHTALERRVRLSDEIVIVGARAAEGASIALELVAVPLVAQRWISHLANDPRASLAVLGSISSYRH